MAGFPDVENETGVGVELKSSTPWTQTITDLQLTAVRVRLSMPSILKSDPTTGDITGYSV
jgi:predicted phage tail protein